MRPLKIFDINMHHHWGGQPNRILTYNKILKQRGHQVVVSGPKDCVLCQRAKQAGLEIFDDLELKRGFRPWSQMPDYKRLKNYFDQMKFDIVHTHGSQDTWLAALAAKRSNPKIPVVRTRHNSFPIGNNFANRWLYKKIIDRVVTVSPQTNEMLTRDGLFQEKNIHAIYSAPDADRFRPDLDNTKLRQEFKIQKDDLIIGMVGRLAPEKGHKDLIASAPAVLKEFPNVKFMLVGKGRSEPELRAQIDQLGIEKNFILTGFRTDVPELVSLFDIFTLTPIAGETLGTSILEGFLMEKPAVATDVGGVCESVRDGETGFLVPSHNPQALTQAYLKLLSDPQKRTAFGTRGRQMALQEFSAENLAEKHEKIYYALSNI